LNQEPVNYDFVWITSEVCYYLGLVLAILFMPALTFILWVLSLTGRADPNYWYILIVWVLSLLMFLAGVGIKNFAYSARSNQKNG